MKPKTQMRIGLWGAIAITVFGVYQFIHQPSLSVEGLGMLTSLIIFAVYIFGIIRKKHKTVRGAYRFWWISMVVLLGIGFIGLFLCANWGEWHKSLLMILVIFLCTGVPFGIMTLILWTGLRGLERIMKAEKAGDL